MSAIVGSGALLAVSVAVADSAAPVWQPTGQIAQENPQAVPAPATGLAAGCEACGACSACGACCACGGCSACSANNPCATECVVPRLATACGACGAACGGCNPCAAACSPCNPSAEAACCACGACGACGGCGAAPELDLSNDEAQAAYDCIRGTMTVGYAKADLMSEAGENIAVDYLYWARFNTAPYQSATHGNRFVNNFANPAAADDYGNYEDGGAMPAGSILAKESFTVSARGMVSPGPLYVMEKMPARVFEESGDWRYSMVLPNGKVSGITNGAGSDQVEFCIGCHMAAGRDTMFILPDEWRQ